MWEEQTGKQEGVVAQEFSFGHVVFATNMRHPRRDEDLALEFRENVLARDTNSGVDGISVTQIGWMTAPGHEYKEVWCLSPGLTNSKRTG